MTVIAWMITILAGIVFISLLVTLRGAPYVPSRSRDVRRAFDELYAIGADDVLVDIGSGDGVVLRLAAERGARAVGYELNPFLVLLSRWLNRRYRGTKVRWADVWLSHVPAETTIIYVFGTSRDMPKIVTWAQAQADRLEKPLFLLSYGFEAPDQSAARSYGAHHLYELKPLQRRATSV